MAAMKGGNSKGFKAMKSEKVSGGKSGQMAKFSGVGAQKPGVSSVSKGSTAGKFAKGGSSSGMAKFSPVGAQKPGVSSVSKGKK